MRQSAFPVSNGMDKLELSIVIAAYNEESRLPGTIERVRSLLDAENISFEFVIVDDGSRDRTLEIVKSVATADPRVRWLTHFPNRGRGVSIREGVLSAMGEFILETDADGSVADEAILRFLRYFKDHPEIHAIFGSRQLAESRIISNQPFLRIFLGYGFIYLTRVLFRMPKVTDFMLGFKMFRAEAAGDVFRHQYDAHFVAEAEITYAAKRRGWKSAELPVLWTDSRDSRVRPIRESFRSLKGLVRILLRDLRGVYTENQSLISKS